MSIYKDKLIDFLSEIQYPNPDILISKLELYQKLLHERNLVVNMVSRKMPLDWYWTHHFLDSLLAMKCLDFTSKSALDFGTGGGLPGLPLKMANGSLRVTLLDSTNRKIEALKQILLDLGKPQEMAVCARLEDYASMKGHRLFDYVICRAVALEPRYVKPLRELLLPNGMVVFYKAQKIDDIAHLPYKVEHERQDDLLGYRRIITVKRKDLR
jgi:16S rRNA (guanine527-N7)-methyltransferase